jgi:acyl-CoA synthetase (NDP forming)
MDESVPFDLEKLINPASIAVVGASTREQAVGLMVIRNLQRQGFPGTIYPVNPRYGEVAGLPCYPSLSDIPGGVDAVFIAIPAEGGPEVLEEAAARGVRAAFINGSGYGDGGPEGEALQRRVEAICARHGIALCGPNNLGLINVRARAPFWTTGLPGLEPGPVAIVSQSGSVAIALAQDERHLGLAYVITTGNEAVCEVADYLAYLVRDEGVQTVMLFLEQIRDPAKFAAAAAEAARRGKRVLAVKVGRSAAGRAAVAGHTGALSGEDAVYDAFFRRHGIVRLDDLDELNEAAVLFSAYPEPPASPKVAAITLSGGESALIADLAATVGVDMPALSSDVTNRLRTVLPPFTTLSNPLDIWGNAWGGEIFREILDALAIDRSIGLIACAADPPNAGGYDLEVVQEMAEILAQRAPEAASKFLLFNNMTAATPNASIAATLGDAGIPYLSGAGAALAAIARWSAYRGPARDDAALADGSAWRRKLADDPRMAEPDLFALLVEAGVPMAASRRARSVDEAAAIAEALGYPVALKATAPELPHKSDLGLVRLALPDRAALGAAFRELDLYLGAHPELASGACITVQPMAGPGIELIVGVRNDPAFGSILAVGLGGTQVELLKEVSLRLGPVNRETALAMLAETHAATFLRGVRGRGPYDMEAAADFIAALSGLGAALAGVAALVEVNPVIVSEKGAIGVDALIEML